MKRPVSWLGALLSFVPFGFFVGLSFLLQPDTDRALVQGALAFLLYRVVIVRFVVLKHHRRGLALNQAGRFDEAFEAFERSAKRFERLAWLDRLRWVLLGSATPYRFVDLARYNQAYALLGSGAHAQAMELLDDLVARTPNMHAAIELRANLARQQSPDGD